MDEIQKRKAEQAALAKYAALKHAESDVIAASRIYFDMTGDWEAALVLDELMFWTLPKAKTGKTSLKVWRDGNTWLAVSRAEWWERKRLTERQADRAIAKLVALGLIEKELYKYNAHPTTHLRLIVTKFFELMGLALEQYYKPDEPEEKTELRDLYAMMGIPISPFGDIDLPNGDIDSPNGEMINSTHQPLPELNDEESKSQTIQAQGKNLFTLYEENIGLITAMQADELMDAEKTFPAAWFEPAIKIALDNNKRKWSYVRSILQGWKDNYFGWKPEYSKPSYQPKPSAKQDRKGPTVTEL
jgi:DnaD/phage-associated family protein